MKVRLMSLVVCLAVTVPVLAQETKVPAEVTSLNGGFRSAYANAKKDILAKMGPVIVAAGDNVVLVDGNEREVVNTISPDYTLLKTVDHVPLALFVLLESNAGQALTESQRQALKGIMDLVAHAKPSVTASQLPPETKTRLDMMLSQSTTFASEVDKQGSVNKPKLDAFIASLRQATLDNVYDATALELSALDAAVQKWKAQIPADRWANLHAVVASGHMPRDRERRMQYFGALLGEKREGGRLVYMEGSDDVDKALDLLATHILDESISREYFKDKWRMHRDLLSDAAARYLKKHPPSK